MAAPGSDAVGAVRLTLLPRRLEIELLRAASYKESFAPAALTQLVRMSVPYTAVRGLVRTDDGLALSLDPSVASPYARFVLAHFTDLPLEALATAHRRRATLRGLLAVVPALGAALASALLPSAYASGWLGRGAVALVVFAALFGVLARLVRLVSLGGPWSERLREAFARRLAQRMGLEPRPAFDTDPFELPEPLPPRAARPALAAGLRLRLALAALSVLGVVGVLALADRLQRTPAAPVIDVALASGVSARAELAGARLPDPSKLPSCSCVRTDSPLWRGPLPALSVLPIPKGGGGLIAPVADDEGVHRYEFDVAVVNNAAVSLRDVRVVLTFARRNARGERVGVTDRGLFWEGELRPARSVKWTVRAPGTELRIDVDEARSLDELGPAPPDAFVRLLEARYPAVRLHAATMLAWHGDPRARAAAEGLSGLTPEQELVRTQLLRASAPVSVCELRQTGEELSACVHNRGERAVERLELVEVAPDGGRRVPLALSLSAGQGRRVSVPGFGLPAEELEARERSASPPAD